MLHYLWPCDNFHVVHQPSEGGRHLVDDAMKQKLLGTMKHESSSHHQDGAVHLSFGFIRRCQRKVRMKETAKQIPFKHLLCSWTCDSAHFSFLPQQSMLCRMALSRPRALLSSWFMMALFLERWADSCSSPSPPAPIRPSPWAGPPSISPLFIPPGTALPPESSPTPPWLLISPSKTPPGLETALLSAADLED